MENHIKCLDIESYRGLKNLKLERLGAINILVGDNNIGKTSVLEAIQLFSNPTKGTLYKVMRQREYGNINMADSFRYLFDIEPSNKENYKINISGIIKNEEEKVVIEAKEEKNIFDLVELSKINASVKYKLKKNPFDTQEEGINWLYRIDSKLRLSKEIKKTDADGFEYSFDLNKYTKSGVILKRDLINVSFIQTIDHLVGNPFKILIQNIEIKENSLELLRYFDNTIKDLRYINEDEAYVPIIENNKGDYIPLSLYGDGLKKALTLLEATIKAKNGILLVDEFETALHTSIMKKVFKFIAKMALSLNVQLFLTTHSLEAVDKFLESNDELLEDIRIIRLKKHDNKNFARVMVGDEALENRKEYDMELRI